MPRVAGFPLWCLVAPDAKHWIGIPLLYLCVLTAPFALVGAIVEIVVGFSRVLRATFGILIVAVLIALVIGPHGLGIPIMASAGLVLYLGGGFMGVLRIFGLRKAASVLSRLEDDLEKGIACEFAGIPPADTPVPEALKRKGVRFAPDRRIVFAALPKSGVLVSIDGRFVDSYEVFQAAWDPLEITTTATGGGMEIPLAVPLADTGLAQRHALPRELEEIRSHRERLLRRAGLSFLGLTYFAAQIARLGEIALAGKLKVELSGSGWIIAAGFGAVVAARFLLLRMRLGRALEGGRILLVRDPAASLEAPPQAELLMGTQVLWTENGEPAPWRRQRF